MHPYNDYVDSKQLTVTIMEKLGKRCIISDTCTSGVDYDSFGLVHVIIKNYHINSNITISSKY